MSVKRQGVQSTGCGAAERAEAEEAGLSVEEWRKTVRVWVSRKRRRHLGQAAGRRLVSGRLCEYMQVMPQGRRKHSIKHTPRRAERFDLMNNSLLPDPQSRGDQRASCLLPNRGCERARHAALPVRAALAAERRRRLLLFVEGFVAAYGCWYYGFTRTILPTKGVFYPGFIRTQLSLTIRPSRAHTSSHMSGHHPATVRLAGRKRHARFESSEALAEQPAQWCAQPSSCRDAAPGCRLQRRSSVNILTAWPGRVAQAPRPGRARAPWS